MRKKDRKSEFLDCKVLLFHSSTVPLLPFTSSVWLIQPTMVQYTFPFYFAFWSDIWHLNNSGCVLRGSCHEQPPPPPPQSSIGNMWAETCRIYKQPQYLSTDGSAQFGSALLGKARLSSAQLGTARHGSAVHSVWYSLWADTHTWSPSIAFRHNERIYWQSRIIFNCFNYRSAVRVRLAIVTRSAWLKLETRLRDSD
jgi:hypothetical protein